MAAMEESGTALPPESLNNARGLIPKSIKKSVFAGTGVLLIPESLSDTVSMYDPYDGTYLGDLILNDGAFSTPINAVPGPDGNLYLSDQVKDSVFVFDTLGNPLYTYADGTDGLNNIRGIDFYNGHLFVTSGDDYVAEFDGPHSRLPDFIADGTDPFDILFLKDGTSLLCDIQGTTDNVRHYDAAGVLIGELFKTNFPEQVQVDSAAPGAYMSIAFSGDEIVDFDLDTTIYETTFFNGGRGIWRLGNGNLLATAGDGVWEIEPGTGTLVDQKKTGSARFVEYWETDLVFLKTDVDNIPEATGGVVNFTLTAGLDNAGKTYVLLGSMAGKAPGLTLPSGNTLGLVWDAFSDSVLGSANNMVFQNFIGVFDGTGTATATLDSLGPINPGFVGTKLYFAYTTFYYPWEMVSNTAVIEIE